MAGKPNASEGMTSTKKIPLETTEAKDSAEFVEICEQDEATTRDVRFCEDCDSCIKEGQSWTWMCLEVPRYGTGFVTRKFYDQDKPYERCVRVNAFGNCRWWTPIPEGSDSTEAEREAKGKKRGE